MAPRRFSSPACVAALALLTAGAARAEGWSVEMPRRNPRGRVAQVVGLTEIAVEYSSPAARGRALWGAAVPFGQPWRAGDHPAAHISFDRDVTFGGQKVAAGKYALLAIPGPAAWTLVLDRDLGLLESTRELDATGNAARVEVRPKAAPHRERLAFLFSDFTDEQTSLDLEWERLRVSVPIAVGTRQQVAASIAALDGAWRSYASAARYMLETKKDYDAGLAYVGKSLALAHNDENTALEASLLAAKAASQGKTRGQGREAAAGGTVALAATRRTAGARTAAAADIEDPPAPAVASAPATVSSAAPAPLQPATEPATFEPASASTAVLADRPERRVSARAPGRGPGARPGASGASASGTPAPSEIAPVIQRGRADIQGCYQRALRKDPSLVSGKITISISVGSSGTVRGVSLDSSEPLRALEPCIKEVVARWAFPLSSAEYGAEMPVVLQGRE